MGCDPKDQTRGRYGRFVVGYVGSRCKVDSFHGGMFQLRTLFFTVGANFTTTKFSLYPPLSSLSLVGNRGSMRNVEDISCSLVGMHSTQNLRPFLDPVHLTQFVERFPL